MPVPADLQGTSLLAALRGELLQGPEAAITEHDDWTSLRTGDHHYLVHADGCEHLWDLGADPGERTDLAGAPEATGDLAHHRLLLRRRLLRARRTLARTWPY